MPCLEEFLSEEISYSAHDLDDFVVDDDLVLLEVIFFLLLELVLFVHVVTE